MSTEVRLIVALDIGTACSGYAYRFVNEPDVVYTSSFHGKPKTPTSILLNKNDKFLAYGQEAEDKYVEMYGNGDNTVKLFRNFKTAIHHNATLSKKTTVRDISGQYSVPIFDLLAMSVRYLKNHVMRWINRLEITYNEDDAYFVVLVPAVFDDRAKWLIRETSAEGGINMNQFTLALEAEASSLWCQHENINGIRQKETRYIVCDIGGGTVDIATHESCGDGSVDSVHYPCGGDWAGIQVINCLKSYLTLLFGTQSMEYLVLKHPLEWFKLLQDFEKARDSKVKGECNKVSIPIPESLRKSAVTNKGLKNTSELTDIIKSPNFGGHFKLEGNMLVVDDEAMKGLFTYTVNSIVSALDKLYHKGVVIGEIINQILFVGGMINNETFQEMLKESLNRYDTIFVKDSDVFAVKGGVLYGHQKSLVRTRVMPLTYGIRTTVPYNDNKHFNGNAIMLNGSKLCTDNFHVLALAGSVVSSGQEVIGVDKPLKAEDADQVFEIYSCGLSDEVPSTVTHYSVQKEATFKVPLPFGCLVDDKEFELCAVLGEPELSFRVTFKKGNKEPFKRSMSY